MGNIKIENVAYVGYRYVQERVKELKEAGFTIINILPSINGNLENEITTSFLIIYGFNKEM